MNPRYPTRTQPSPRCHRRVCSWYRKSRMSILRSHNRRKESRFHHCIRTSRCRNTRFQQRNRIHRLSIRRHMEHTRCRSSHRRIQFLRLSSLGSSSPWPRYRTRCRRTRPIAMIHSKSIHHRLVGSLCRNLRSRIVLLHRFPSQFSYSTIP